MSKDIIHCVKPAELIIFNSDIPQGNFVGDAGIVAGSSCASFSQ